MGNEAAALPVQRVPTNDRLEGVRLMEHSRPHAPELPPEIWRLIFVFAVRRPGLMDTSPPIPGSNVPRAYTGNLARFLSTDEYDKATKDALILVSKLWWSLSIDLFYEYVSLRRPSQLLALVKALEMNISRPAGSSTVSTYVRHLCILLFNPWDLNQINNAFDKLFSILSKHPNSEGIQQLVCPASSHNPKKGFFGVSSRRIVQL
jgi:hypothetical protein